MLSARPLELYFTKNGRAEGRLEGKLEGKLEERLEVALEAIKEGLPLNVVAKITGLNIDEVKELVSKIANN